MANHGQLLGSRSSTNNQDGGGLVSERGTEEWMLGTESIPWFGR